MDEFEIIAEIFAPLATAPGAFGLKDDAAAIPARPGFDMIATTDQIAQDIDFFAFDPAAEIAQKALRVNLSDLAAKGAGVDFQFRIRPWPGPSAIRSFAVGRRHQPG